jgi:hypothetical protein
MAIGATTAETAALFIAFAIRLCYVNRRSNLAEVEDLARAMERIGVQVWGECLG